MNLRDREFTKERNVGDYCGRFLSHYSEGMAKVHLGLQMISDGMSEITKAAQLTALAVPDVRQEIVAQFLTPTQERVEKMNELHDALPHLNEGDSLIDFLQAHEYDQSRAPKLGDLIVPGTNKIYEIEDYERLTMRTVKDVSVDDVFASLSQTLGIKFQE